MQRLGTSALIVLGLLTSGCASAKYAQEMKGTQAPDFELASLDGGKVKLSDYRGKPVLLAFWAYG